ncbi:hypothetical protein [Yinghuangia seranimata]|uniref:hypothetical protein n=1 Tax=Yinghuangia seranimata TaxID=408067 RepID=UPI00248C1DEE|nr:hypothetical protein [Yinghuangia seranimata]MDI2125746.1 hypothetical protein [Yinghuangia seranimata]
MDVWDVVAFGPVGALEQLRTFVDASGAPVEADRVTPSADDPTRGTWCVRIASPDAAAPPEPPPRPRARHMARRGVLASLAAPLRSVLRPPKRGATPGRHRSKPGR